MRFHFIFSYNICLVQSLSPSVEKNYKYAWTDIYITRSDLAFAPYPQSTGRAYKSLLVLYFMINTTLNGGIRHKTHHVSNAFTWNKGQIYLAKCFIWRLKIWIKQDKLKLQNAFIIYCDSLMIFTYIHIYAFKYMYVISSTHFFYLLNNIGIFLHGRYTVWQVIDWYTITVGLFELLTRFSATLFIF